MPSATLRSLLVFGVLLVSLAQCRRHLGPIGGPFKQYDNSLCFKGVYDYDNCPEKPSLHDCVRCCSELRTYYGSPPSKNVCLAACADKFPKLGIEWTYL